MHVLLQAFVLGVIGGAIPGTVLSILLVSVLQGGLRAGSLAFLWSMLSEVAIVGVLLLVATHLPLGPQTFVALGGVGGIVLLYFAWRVFSLRAIRVEESTLLFKPWKIFAIHTVNGPLYVFWITICVPLIWQLSSARGLPTAAISFFIIFEIGWALTTLLIMMLFVFSRTTLTNERIMHRVFSVIALVFVGLGAKMLITSITQFL